MKLIIFIIAIIITGNVQAKVIGILTERFISRDDVCKDCGFQNSDIYVLNSNIVNALKFSCVKYNIKFVSILNNDTDASYYAKTIDGIIVPDYKMPINPKLYGKSGGRYEKSLQSHISQYDMDILKESIEAKKPVLAINRGMLLLNVIYGGSLMNDVTAKFKNHNLSIGEKHEILIEKKSKLGNIIFDDKIEKLEVNSFHTQGIDTLGDGLKISSKSIDGSIESIESNGSNFVIGVQWNPEYLMSSYDVELFDKFCKVVAQS
jgi:putative glutamine amidotransferase